ncbi:phytoene/squalene synthase family protein [Tsuneonella mangrovi]|uniref:phytoene/squalene synthase family protein n=1 Tax=Tsuneonella mangrovi TaxID=1982042 RepID=UPI000BA212D2|nr:phytoene/squalene synthase family protein [Tsuneonella mangrovi]
MSSSGGQDRAALVEAAHRSISEGSKSFSAASRLFDRPTRERAWLLYAWCRRCDDIADGQVMGGALSNDGDPVSRIATIRQLTERAFEGVPTGDEAFDALGLVARECGLTRQMADDVIEGFALDAAGWRPRTGMDLARYCYHVAGAVGVMMAVVMGVSTDDTETLDRACDLGIAFQLANIARDIAEDDRADRCYLPVEWLVEEDIEPGQHMKPHHREELAAMAARLVRRMEKHEAMARLGAAKLPFRSRWAVLSAARIYGAIGRKVVALGPTAWDHRVIVSRPAKLGHALAALWEALRNSPAAPAEPPEWTRGEILAEVREAGPIAPMRPTLAAQAPAD